VKNAGVLFRVDGSSSIGMGHIRRCIALAQTCRQYDVPVYFACNEVVPELVSDLEQAGITLLALELREYSVESDVAAMSELLARHAIAWFVIDHPALSIDYERQLRQFYDHTLVVIDGRFREHDCDVLINPNVFATLENTRSGVTESCTVLAGYSYFILDDCYLVQNQGAAGSVDSSDTRRILVTLGAADPDNVTLRLCESLARADLRSDDCVIDVVVGNANRHKQSIENFVSLDSREYFNLVHAPSNLCDLLASCTICVSAGGITLGEASYLGKPIVGVAILENQRQTIEAMQQAGACIAASPDTIGQVCQQLLNDGNARRTLSLTASNLVDGRGKHRIAMHTWGATIE
jgi:UDP-2,4-diacetamido-2,4,6-trideoxy-beta-L-altropyranose hydrolase